MMSTTIAAVISVLLSLGIAAVVMRMLYDYFMQEMAGWLTYYVDPANYVWAVVLGMASYGVSAALQYRKIGKVGLEAALKRADL
jgi:putative ABC transport system permease protein